MSTASTLRLGTRGSPLALAQSGQVARQLERRTPGLTVELVPVVTRGDREPGDLAPLGGKGLFTAELEQGLADGSLDLAVHSLKDLPVTLPAGLALVAHPERADPRDALICATAGDVDGLPAGAVVLTGSLRRRAQLLARRPDLEVRALRGNVDTRLAAWRASGAAAVVLAAAGLDRLGRAGGGLPVHRLPPEQMLPAPGQGILAVEARPDGAAAAACRALDHPATAEAARAERRVVAAFGGDCTLPLAAWARRERGVLVLDALLATPDGRTVARGSGRADDGEEAARACIAALRAAGADEVLERIRRAAPAGAR